MERHYRETRAGDLQGRGERLAEDQESLVLANGRAARTDDRETRLISSLLAAHAEEAPDAAYSLRQIRCRQDSDDNRWYSLDPVYP
jgi:hypothetical protein